MSPPEPKEPRTDWSAMVERIVGIYATDAADERHMRSSLQALRHEAATEARRELLAALDDVLSTAEQAPTTGRYHGKSVAFHAAIVRADMLRRRLIEEAS